MRYVCTAPMRQTLLPILALAALLAIAEPVSAQGFGIGARLAWVTSDTELDVDSVRFFGGQIRLLSQRVGLEVSIDRHSESFELVNQKVTETPIQASVLLRLASGSISPFLLAGPGWYRRSVEAIEGPDVRVNTTEFGWHAGGGLEFRPGRHFGVHGDYRYTFLDFGDDDEEDDEGFVGGLLPGHRGSMWTLGATVYF
jgi:opacity protein-like surface antigen